MNIEVSQYPEVVRSLLCFESNIIRPSFDFSVKSGADAKRTLGEISSAQLFTTSIASPMMADACLSGLWLLHGYLHQSHELSQSIPTPEGSYWHAIMHRAEGDFWNSKYWYRKVGEKHSVIRQLLSSSPDGAGEALVDLCESAGQNETLREKANGLATQEWWALFEYCWKRATNL